MVWRLMTSDPKIEPRTERIKMYNGRWPGTVGGLSPLLPSNSLKSPLNGDKFTRRPIYKETWLPIYKEIRRPFFSNYSDPRSATECNDSVDTK